LTGSAGVQNPALQAAVLTIGGTGPSVSLGANLVQPIFDHGRLRAQRDAVEAKDRELLSAYRGAILAALVDVENALSAIRHLEDARQFQVDNLAQTTKAYEGAKLRYQSGAGDFLLVLEAQRSLFAARDQFVQYKLGRLQALVSLAKALGGGWSQHPESDAESAILHRTTNP
jgi:outer membrane protein TolC